jgi:hypothetical protein
MIHAARRGGHLSRHERQRLARAEAFSRRTPAGAAAEVPVKPEEDELEMIDRLSDRTAVSKRAGGDRRREIGLRCGVRSKFL